MVQAVSTGHESPELAATSFGKDNLPEAINSKREPNAGIVRIAHKDFAYTRPLWGEPGAKTVDVGDYTAALLAVWGNQVAGFVHAHWDRNLIFSPPDVLGRGRWTYYLSNRAGETRKLDDGILEEEIRRSGARNLPHLLLIQEGAKGKCVDGCGE